MSIIRENLLRVTEKIEKAAQKVGRNPAEIKLVAVSKTVEAGRIQEAIEAGVAILGENYVQEAQKKIEEIGRSISWHFIGHLQSNKAKYAIRLFDMIHSVDSIPLVEELNRRAEKEGRTMEVMIEVNLSGEASKFGIEEEKAFDIARKVLNLKNLSLMGLMTMPPYFDNPELSRPYYVQLRQLKEKMAGEGIPLKELSMGMSNDFDVAIEEGATYVRVGTAIFGARK
ncbi:MAG: YggS family pyridoxal phosphate-dependent enzyme [Deltaproteobacteria bacterium]|nr:YggS family pyridoxal phosphate-dependent enzyme [Deltaproteobacteria bacterium]MBM4322276.1 YggS family pyridoxal phosphate-dependent enzyme [Deltaproteobacteria bacterium]